MRPVTIFALVALFAGLAARPALACSCLVPPPPLEALEQAEAVFVGTVVDLRLEEGPHGGQYRVRFRVDRAVKGAEGREVTVRTAEQSATCGYYFRPGKQYLVYAHRDGDGLGVSLCSRTARVPDAAEDLRALGIEEGAIEGSDLVGTGGRCGGPGNAAALQAVLFVLLVVLARRRR